MTVLLFVLCKPLKAPNKPKGVMASERILSKERQTLSTMSLSGHLPGGQICGTILWIIIRLQSLPETLTPC